LAASATSPAARVSTSLGGIRDDTSQPTPKAMSPAASGFPSAWRRAASGAAVTVSAAVEAADDTESRAEPSVSVAVPAIDDARPCTVPPAALADPKTRSFTLASRDRVRSTRSPTMRDGLAL
jgi:hypothetical protein